MILYRELLELLALSRYYLGIYTYYLVESYVRTLVDC